jgi:hypothetical protein
VKTAICAARREIQRTVFGSIKTPSSIAAEITASTVTGFPFHRSTSKSTSQTTTGNARADRRTFFSAEGVYHFSPPCNLTLLYVDHVGSCPKTEAYRVTGTVRALDLTFRDTAQ